MWNIFGVVVQTAFGAHKTPETLRSGVKRPKREPDHLIWNRVRERMNTYSTPKRLVRSYLPSKCIPLLKSVLPVRCHLLLVLTEGRYWSRRTSGNPIICSFFRWPDLGSNIEGSFTCTPPISLKATAFMVNFKCYSLHSYLRQTGEICFSS